MYVIRFPSRTAQRQLEHLPAGDYERVAARLYRLAEDPRPAGLVALEPNTYRLRVGRYRVVYRVDDEREEVLIGRITARNERTYRRWEDIF